MSEHSGADISDVLNRIQYKDWEFRCIYHGHHAELQLCWRMPDSRSGEPRVCKSRKWRLSYHMTESEIVFTALAAVKMAEEHELHEHFKYRDHQLVNPHVKVSTLLAANIDEDRRHSVETEESDGE